MEQDKKKIIAAHMADIGRKGGQKTGTTKVRGDKAYYASISAKGVAARNAAKAK